MTASGSSAGAQASVFGLLDPELVVVSFEYIPPSFKATQTALGEADGLTSSHLK